MPEPTAAEPAPSTGPQRVAGIAANAKGGAVVQSEGQVLYVHGMDAWPEGVTEREVVLHGTVGREAYLPEATVTEDGAISQGVAPGGHGQMVLHADGWKLKERPASGLPPAPWEIRYADGSGNVSRIWRGAPGEPMNWAYDPVTPEQSSSGIYSGGEPARGTLEEGQALAFWAKAQTFLEHTELHAEARAMGTGSLRLYRVEEGEQSLILSRAGMLDAFEESLTELRTEAETR